MRQIILLSVMSVLLLTMHPDAEAARRFGGGVSLGRPAPAMMQKAPAPQTQSNTFQQSRTQANQQAPRTGMPQPQAKPSMLGGMLTGLAAALGITALLSMLGIHGSGMVSLIMGVALAFLAYVIIRRLFGGAKTRTAGPINMDPPRPTRQEAPTPEPVTQMRAQEPAPNARRGSVMDELMSGTLNQPADQTNPTQTQADAELASFDEASFLKVALENYRKLQDAWATGQVLAISDFVSDDIFIAITHQMRDRQGQQFTIDAYDIKNELNGIMRQGDEYLASVRFYGTMTLSGEQETIDENWLLAKPVDGSKGWLLVGITPNA